MTAIGVAACGTLEEEAPLEQAPAPITASYKGVPEDAQVAFQEAVDIWSACLVSDVPIKIHLEWIPRGPTGFATPHSHRNEPHLPVADVWYPAALSNALRGARKDDLDDMNIFLSARANWYYGPVGGIAEDQIDFVNVAVHEIAHGLGLSSTTFTPWDGEGGRKSTLGTPNPFVTFFNYTFPDPIMDGTPSYYDTLVRTSDGRSLTEFPNDSLVLTEALEDPGIVFIGQKTAAENGGAPLGVTPGNITHIPMQPGKPTPIMLSDSGQGESLRQPDRLLLAMLEDMGWTISEACRARAV